MPQFPSEAGRKESGLGTSSGTARSPWTAEPAYASMTAGAGVPRRETHRCVAPRGVVPRRLRAQATPSKACFRYPRTS